MNVSRTKARRAAVQAIYQWQLTGQEAGDIEAQFVAERDLAHVDLDYFKDLLHGVTLHLHELDDQIVPFLDRRLEEVDPVERAILRMGAYELRFRSDVPYKAVINEAVELAKTFGAEHGHRYVNSILDHAARNLRASETTPKGTKGIRPS